MASSIAHMLPPMDGLVREWLEEDISHFDIGGAVVGDAPKVAHIFAKSDLTLAGYPFVEAIFSYLQCQVQWECPEGTDVVLGADERKRHVGTVRGPANRVLQGERTALEVLVRASSIATLARKARQAAKDAGFAGDIAGTRKTTPGGFRKVEKYALSVAGVDSHRYSLSTMVMLKDNHIDACGGITGAVREAKKLAGFTTKIEVEARTEEDALEACRAGADIVMLDNFGAEKVGAAAQRIKEQFPHCIVEVSGGINLTNVADFSRNAKGVDIISMGCLTQGVASVDLSMKIQAS